MAKAALEGCQSLTHPEAPTECHFPCPSWSARSRAAPALGKEVGAMQLEATVFSAVVLLLSLLSKHLFLDFL